MDPIPFDLEAHLDRHGASLRQLAHELVRDRTAIDDALQETWLRALQRPPRHEAQVGGWLATILRHVVGRARRGERRRQRREQEVARASHASDPAEPLARTEMAARLVAAVRALDAPYRDVVWMRYFDGLPPREIAVREHLPLLTVKSRLQRGLQQLRERLGEGGESSDWRGALAGAFGFEVGTGAAAAGTVAAWQGGLLMAAWTKGVAAAAVVAIAAVWWWWPQEPARPFENQSAASALAAAADPVAHDATTLREPAAVPDLPSAPVSEEPEAQFVRVRGRVVDADTNQPLPDAEVSVDDGKQAQRQTSVAAGVTATDGRFEIACDAARRPRVWFTHPDHAAISVRIEGLQAGQVEDLGDLPLPRGRRVSGRVVDVRGDPLPVACVANAAWSSSRAGLWQQAGSSSARTRADGSFVLEDPVRLGDVTFSADSDDYELVDLCRVVVTPHTPTEVVLVMRPRERITGLVVDSTGQALADIGLGCLPGIVETRSAGDGSFCLVKRYRNTRTSTQVHVVDAPDFTPPPEVDVMWGTKGVNIVLSPASPLPLEVVDSAGAPVTAFGVVLWRRGLDPGQEGTVRQRGVHDGGRLLVERVLPGQTTLRVLPSDPMLVPSDKIRVPNLAPMRVELVRRVPCTVEVSKNGQPVAGARVELVRDDGRYAKWYATLTLLRMPGPRIDPHTAERSTDHVERVAAGATAPDGTATLARDPVTAGCTLLVQAVGQPVHCLFEPAFPVDGRPLRVELTPHGEISGHVDLRGRLRFDVQVVFRVGDRSDAVAPQPDGTYRSPLLPVGPCSVELQFGEAATKQAVPQSVHEVQVTADAATVVDFDLADFVMASVRGAVAGATGERRLSVDLLRLDGDKPQVLGTAAVGAGGTFGPVDLVPGTYRLALRQEPATADVTGLAADTFEVAAGEQRWIDVPAPRRLVVHLRRPDGSVVRGERVIARCGGLQFPSFTMFMRAVDEQIVLDPAPSLPVEFRNHAHTAPWSAAVVMPPDQAAAEVTVVLPDPPR